MSHDEMVATALLLGCTMARSIRTDHITFSRADGSIFRAAWREGQETPDLYKCYSWHSGRIMRFDAAFQKPVEVHKYFTRHLS